MSNFRGFKKSKGVRFTLIALVLGAAIYIVPSGFLDNTVRIGTDTADYIWYLRSDLEWKHSDYKKH